MRIRIIHAAKKPREFSKKVLAAVMTTYFVGVAVGGYIVTCRLPELLGELLAFIGGVSAVAVGFYAWKAKAENLQKYSALPTDDMEGGL
ncbi:MAG: hypothetical protein Q4B96_05275 [Bacillota bacterium]|nr:hypothetical protein [Bacillota bacterium]